MKASGPEKAEALVAPPHQRLEAGKLHVGQARDRLIEHLDLVALDGAAQFRLKQHEFGAVIAHRLAEELDRVLAAPLRLIERDGGVLHQPFGG